MVANLTTFLSTNEMSNNTLYTNDAVHAGITFGYPLPEHKAAKMRGHKTSEEATH